MLHNLFKQCDGVLLTLPRRVNVGEEQWNVMAAQQGHHTLVVEFFTFRLRSLITSSRMSLTAALNCLLGYRTLVSIFRLFPGSYEPFADTPNLVRVHNVVERTIKGRTVARGGVVPVAEVAIHGDYNVWSTSAESDSGLAGRNADPFSVRPHTSVAKHAGHAVRR